ncbi:MAG TPA: ABC transporter ATP-binding protein [Clostridia bacterium]|nr:ABC transporter ATP-binding protein [Clostridia bacterium]
MIQIDSISKSFRVSQRQAGFGQALKALFSREYNTIHALDDISFEIKQGEMVGYIGPNGAGKSTTIKIMCGILRPDSGECMIGGRIPWKDRKNHAKEIGVVFGQRSQLWWDVPVIDSFELIRDIYRVDMAKYRKNLDALVEQLDIGEIIKTPTRSLSLGQRMRCEIAASLLHSPNILFLDEPTIGLDAVSKIAVRQFIRKLNTEKNTTVILTTHDMQDIEALTERIILIGRGKILLDGDLQELKGRISTLKTLTVDYTGPAPVLEPGWTVINHREGHIAIQFDSQKDSVSGVIAQVSKNTGVRDISVNGISAEEMVAGLYTEYRI